jgi:hypothetical protein
MAAAAGRVVLIAGRQIQSGFWAFAPLSATRLLAAGFPFSVLDVSNDDAPAIVQQFHAYGRMKYLRPLYTELAARPETRAQAADLYQRVKQAYHPIARQGVERILGSVS